VLSVQQDLAPQIEELDTERDREKQKFRSKLCFFMRHIYSYTGQAMSVQQDLAKRVEELDSSQRALAAKLRHAHTQIREVF